MRAGRERVRARSRGRQHLDDVFAGGEVEVSGLDGALLADGGVGAVLRDDGAVITNADVDGEVGRHPEGVLHEGGGDATWALGNEHVAEVEVRGVVQQEAGEAVAGLRGLPGGDGGTGIAGEVAG